ncbi:MAG: hypothetical protein PHG91_12640 [Syntrophales bacterium]|nr:hypothetical protein [Syntrophales bacterium]MDD5234233.1 hypothetical protein [Syntrophales bacterium]MDD5532214.1 hypothetical protein [Syntrophales bacterium]
MTAIIEKKTRIGYGKEFPIRVAAETQRDPAERIHYEKKIVYFR